MSETFTLNVKSEKGNLSFILSEVEALGEREAWPPELSFHVQLSIEEIIVNIMDYGYEGLPDLGIAISIASNDSKLTIDIVDSGKAFDPLHDATVPDVNAPIEERPIGGLGIYFARNVMDEMRYRREGDQNHITLIANRDQ